MMAKLPVAGIGIILLGASGLFVFANITPFNPKPFPALSIVSKDNALVLTVTRSGNGFQIAIRQKGQ